MLSCVWLFATLWTADCQAPQSMGLFWQEYWSGLPFPSPRALPGLGSEAVSPLFPALQVDSFTPEPSEKPEFICWIPNPQCGSVWRWGLEKEIVFGWGMTSLGGFPLNHWCPCKGMKRTELSLGHVMIQWDRPVYKLGSRPSTELNHPDPLISDFLLDPGILLQRPSQLRHVPKIGFQIYASWFLIWVEIWDIKWKRFHTLM